MFTNNTLVLNLSTGGTSGVIDVSDRRVMSLQCLYTESISGYVQFGVQVSNNDVNYVNYYRLLTAGVVGILRNQIASSYIRLSSANTTGMLFFPSGDCFKSLKVTAKKVNNAADTVGKVKVWLQAKEN